MAKTTVIGVFENRQQAEKAVDELQKQGFQKTDISVAGKRDGEGARGEGGVGRGATWGAGIGAAAGLLATAGAITVPGLGPLIAAGPLAAALGGAATGGVAGALIEWGIPEQRGRELEQREREGMFVALVEAEGTASQASDVLRRNGAREVESPRASVRDAGGRGRGRV